jgi:hypothetical protein
MLNKGVAGQDSQGRLRHYTSCGLLMHSSLAVTNDGLPLSLAAVKFWTCKKFKGTHALKGMVNPTRVPIEQKMEGPNPSEGPQPSSRGLSPKTLMEVGEYLVAAELLQRCVEMALDLRLVEYWGDYFL